MTASTNTRALLGLTVAALLTAGAASAQTDAPAFLSKAKDLGAAPAATRLSATVHLPLADEKGFNAAVAARYDRKSPLYHKWMSADDIAAFGPAKSDVKDVKRELARFGLTVTDVSPDGAEIDVSGAPVNFQRAFGAQLRVLSVKGKTFVGNTTTIQPQGALAGHILAVTGLGHPGYEPMIRHQLDANGKPVKGMRVDITTSPFVNFSNQCFTTPASRVLTDGTNTVTVAAGAGYAINLSPATPQQTCGYTPDQMLQHYGLDQLHSQGFDGTGQTIVIVDAYGSPTAMSDANAFFSAAGIAPFTKDNFKILYPHGKPTVVNYGWAGETALDIEWAHVIAPGAKIVLVVSQDNQGDLDQAVRYAINRGLGNVISNSWGYSEYYNQGQQAYSKSYDQPMRRAAAKGISVQFSTGDDGDTVISDSGNLPYAGFPAVSAHVTAVGGTTLDVPGMSGAQEVGWGSYRAQLGYDTAPVMPVQQGFYAGAGGGDSINNRKPAWEASIPGKMRHTPDVAMDADPFTGAILVEPTSSGSVWSVIGGTSLASPMFTAVWAIADQMSDPSTPGASLGLAAAMMPQLVSGGAVVDVTGISGTAQLTADFEGSDYTSAGYTGVKDGFTILGIDPVPGGLTTQRLRTDQGTSVISFNTDTSLLVTNGWDNVTGYGVPNGPALQNFVQNLAAKQGQQ